MSADTADALLTYARRTEEEDTATERVYDLLLEGRLEEEHEGLGEMMEWLEEDGPALERREEAQDPDCPLAMAAEQDPEIRPKQDDEPGGDWPVREAIGSLMWLSTMTRPDITNAVRAVARYAHEPTERLWLAIMKILSYLNGTRSLGITYVRGSGLSLNVYADADYASKENDRRSVSGIAVTLGGTVVSHTSKTQRVVSLSTSEAKYIAAGEGVKEALFVRAVLSFIAPETSGASIKVLEDNQGAKALIENPLSSARSKHIDVRYHFIRDLFRTRKNYLEYVASAEQHADILTKALSRANLMYRCKLLMNLAE